MAGVWVWDYEGDAMTEKLDGITPMHWAKSLGSGLLAGAAFVAVAMLVENRAMKVGAKLFQK